MVVFVKIFPLITNVGLILTKLQWFLLSWYGQTDRISESLDWQYFLLAMPFTHTTTWSESIHKKIWGQRWKLLVSFWLPPLMDAGLTWAQQYTGTAPAGRCWCCPLPWAGPPCPGSWQPSPPQPSHTLKTWGMRLRKRLYLGEEVIYGGRSCIWGKKLYMGEEVIYGGRSYIWGKKLYLGEEVVYGGRSCIWGKKLYKLYMGEEVISGEDEL